MIKILKGFIYIISIMLIIVCLAVFFRANIGFEISEDFAEIAGSISAFLLVFEFALFAVIQIFKRGFYPQKLKTQVRFLAKQLKSFHYSLGMLALSLIACHATFQLF